MPPSNSLTEPEGDTSGDRGPDDPPGASPPADREGSAPAPALPEAVRRTLVDLSIALHRHAMYPSGHPALQPAADGVFDGLGHLLREGGELRVEGLKDRVRVGRAETDPSSPHLAALASRLHAHQLAAVGFRPGLESAELADFLETLAEEPSRGAVPLGLRDEAERSWPHIGVAPRRYDPLRLDEEGPDRERPAFGPGSSGADRVVRDEEPPLGGRIGDADLTSEEPEEVARRLEARLGEEDVDRVVALQITRLAERLARTKGTRADLVRRRMSRLILCLKPETLSYLLRFGAEGGREEDFLVAAAQSLDLEAALRLVRAAAEGREGSIEDWLLRFVKKLAMYAGPRRGRGGGEPGDAEAVNEVVDRIVSDWQLEDPRPALYQHTLEHLTATPPAEGLRPRRRLRVEPERVVQMGLEMDEPAEPVKEAVARLVEERRARDLVGMAEEVDETNRVADALWERLAVPETIQGLLHEPDPDFDLVRRIVRRGGVDVAGPLLDALSESNAESRLYWHNVFGLLVEIGAPVVELLPERLEDARWFVRRNLLALLHELPGRPEGFSALPMLEDPDARVRAEALKVALVEPDGRVPSLAAGLRDENERVASLALSAAASGGIPPELEPLVAARAGDPSLPPAVRTRAVQLLSASGSETARRALIDLVWVRRWIFWRKLAPPTGPMLAALGELAEGWVDDPEVAPVLRAAVESPDQKIRTAVSASDPGEEEGP